MTDDRDSDRPRTAISKLFPRAATLPELYDASRAQASQMLGLLEASRNRVRDEKAARARLDELIRELRGDLAQLEGSILQVRARIHEFELSQATRAIPEAYERGAQRTKLAALIGGVILLASFLSALLVRFLVR